jgi:hypothetical protein
MPRPYNYIKHQFSQRKLVGTCVLHESGWSRTDSTTEAIANSISIITIATANSEHNITQQIPQNALCKHLRKTPVSYRKIFGNNVLLESSWSRTDSTTEAIPNKYQTALVPSPQQTANAILRNKFHKMPRPNNYIKHQFPSGNSLETVFCMKVVSQEQIPQQKP